MKKAIVLFSLALLAATGYSQDFKKTEAAFTKSYATEELGNYKQAAEDLKAVYNDKDYALNLRMGWLLYADGQFAPSIEYYTKAIALMPNSIEARFGIVYPLSALNKWDDVLKQYEEILKVDPNQTLANYRAGLIHYNKANYAKAKPYFDKFVALYPFDYDACHMAAWTLLNLGKPAEAKPLFQRALLNRPADKSATEGLAKCK